MRQRSGDGKTIEAASPARKQRGEVGIKAKEPPELYQVVIECRDEGQQRELFERLRGEGMKVRLLVL